MSFISKRERVFVEDVEPEDLPPRQEGKLKCYSSCTDARAWSHFHSDKTEHLVDLIKKDNGPCFKYVPTKAIVDTLMVVKNDEIKRLKSKIEELENLIGAYDRLELTREQKYEIENAHAVIKAAYKDLTTLTLNFDSLNLDISNFTEGPDSEYFETGKSESEQTIGSSTTPVSARRSHGDDWSNKESKGNQADVVCPRDASTYCVDPRIDELRENIIVKDAKLNAMKNSLAVMENDVCEPYCIYAHIYTALEKIFGALCQNSKYRSYLDLLTTGKDSRCSDIRGRILYKLKILEKFSHALLTPCSEQLRDSINNKNQNFSVMHVQTTFNVTPSQSPKPELVDSKRAHLVADILRHEEIKDTISNDNLIQESFEDASTDDMLLDDYSIERENLTRLKNLQLDYDELMICYENIKFERDDMKTKFAKYEEIEKELQLLRDQLQEYNSLWNEKEHFRRRSEDVDALKEQYFVLSEETSNLETRLKAEMEINAIKSDTIDELRNENINLEKRINDLTIAFEKEKNALQCRLKEKECTVMCQDQQIKSLSIQIDRILEHDQDEMQDKGGTPRYIALMDEIESLKDQIKNLKDALTSSDEEKQQLQDQFEEKIRLISDLRLELEDKRGALEKTLQRNDYLEKYTENYRDEVQRLIEDNKKLSHEVDEKSIAVGNLINVINNKSQEVNKLINEVENNRRDNENLFQQLQETREMYKGGLKQLENEKEKALSSLQLAKQESQELLDKVKRYENYDDLKDILMNTIEENKRLQITLSTRDNDNAILHQELQRLSAHAFENINQLQEEKNNYKLSLELTKKESEILDQKLSGFQGLREQLNQMRESQEKLLNEKRQLETELQKKADELDDAMNSIHLSRKESEELLEKIQNSENLKEDLVQLSREYNKLINEKQYLQKDLMNRNKDLDNLLQALNKSKDDNDQLLQKSRQVDGLENELMKLKKAYQDLVAEKNLLQSEFDKKTQQINTLYNTLEKKIEQNKDLSKQIEALENHRLEASSSLVALQNKNCDTEKALESVKQGKEELIDKLKQYEHLSNEYNTLRNTHDLLKQDKEVLQKELEKQLRKLSQIEEENRELNSQSQHLLAHNDDLEKALINARNSLVGTSDIQGPTADIIREITEMKQEKLVHQKNIQELFNKLNQSEITISNMTQEVMARDDKIAILQNHINALEDEVGMLHNTLAQVVNTGEQIKDHSLQKIDQSLNKMEAHHSKATHNMKMELATLQNANAALEEMFSTTKKQSEESFRDKNKYLSQLNHLQNERETIVYEIKQLEIDAVGQSQLLPDTSSLEEITNSLDKIRHSLRETNTKSSSFKQTLLQVQTSSQLLLTKADEAKKIVEAEKQKIINEKEEAVTERNNLEKQLVDLRARLEQQSLKDEKVIRDLEAEILNQELIIDNINKNTNNYTMKLEEEMNSLQELYQNSLAKITELKDTNKNLTEDNVKNLDVIEKIKIQFEEKSKEVAVLQKNLEDLNNRPQSESGIQVKISSNTESVASQTDKYFESENNLNETIKDDTKYVEDIQDSLPINKKKQHKQQLQDKLGKYNKPESINEVQILTANVEPTLNFVKVAYLDYKMKRLSVGKLEQYSLTEEEPTESLKFNESTSTSNDDDKIFASRFTSQGNPTQLFDIYSNDQPSITNSSNPEYINAGYFTKSISESEENKLILIYQDSASNSGRTNNTNNTGQFERSNYIPSKDGNLNVYPNRYDLKTKSDISLSKSPGLSNSLKSLSVEGYAYIRDSEKGLSKNTKLKEKSMIMSDHVSEKTPTQSINKKVKYNKSHSELKDKFRDANGYSSKEVHETNKIKSANNGSDFENISLKSTKVNEDQTSVTHTYDNIHYKNNEKLRKEKEVLTTVEKHSKSKFSAEQSAVANTDTSHYYEEKIRQLTSALENVERDYKHKLEVIKVQYDNNIKHIINEHNLGVKNIQDLHEETLHDIIKVHESETDNLRSMSMEALKRAEKIDKENRMLKSQIFVDLEHTDKTSSVPDSRKRRSRCRCEDKVLTLTSVEAFNVRPKLRSHGPCTCSLDANISDTIRNIFQQVDAEQRKTAEHTYLKYIANKMNNGNIEELDAQELSFLHLKVCRTWKNKLHKEEMLQKRINHLETELMHKQRNTRQHIAELDRKVAKEKRRLQEVRDAVVCRGAYFDDVGESPQSDRCCKQPLLTLRTPATALLTLPTPAATLLTLPTPDLTLLTLPMTPVPQASPKPSAVTDAEKEDRCGCLGERRSAGDLIQGMHATLKPRRAKNETSRATLAKLDYEGRRQKKLLDELPTRLKRTAARSPLRGRKK